MIHQEKEEEGILTSDIYSRLTLLLFFFREIFFFFAELNLIDFGKIFRRRLR